MVMLLANVRRHLVGKSVGAAAVTLLSNGELEKDISTSVKTRKNGYKAYLDTLALGEGDPGLVLTDDEDVGLAGSEGVVNGVLDVDDIETTIVALTVSDNTNTTHVTTTSGHGDNTGVELDEVGDLASGNVNLDGVVDLDGGVRVTDAIDRKLAKPCSVRKGLTVSRVWNRLFCRPQPINQSLVQRLNDTELVESKHSRSRIVRNQEWDPALAKLNTLNLAELELSLLSLDAVDGEATLGVVDQAEVLAGLLEGDDVHETSGEGGVGADLAVNLDQTLHHDGLDLATVQGVLETINAY